MIDITDIRPTIAPKSDQLNAEQLLSGDITITVTQVSAGSDEQPIVIHYEGEEGRPFKPCKTMRKVLAFAWGADATQWAGRSMTLYCDPNVKFGGEAVGGIRISHLSDIPKDIEVKLTATRGKKVLHKIYLLAMPADRVAQLLTQIEQCADLDVLRTVATETQAEARKFRDATAYQAFRAAAIKRSEALQAAGT